MAVEPDRNTIVWLYGKHDLRIEEAPVPQPADDEVLVRIQSCGICGTDIHVWHDGKWEDIDISEQNPFAMGHESSGIVMAKGSKVTNLDIGDRVALELGLPCRKCELCKGGKYNLCKTLAQGGLSQYQCCAADFCYKLPDNVSYDVGALIEPLSVAVRAIRRAEVTPGSIVLVCGAGTIGLCVLLVAKARGATKLCVTDISADRLARAKEMGAHVTVEVQRGEHPQQLASRIESSLGCKPDFTIECSGAEASLQTAIYATTSGGVVAPVGLGQPNVVIPYLNAMTREVDIRGVIGYCNDHPAAISLLASGAVDPTPMITHRFTLKETLKAFEFVESQQPGTLKVIINCADKE